MTSYISTRGRVSPVSFDQAVLQGFASDGGLFVPTRIPRMPDQLLARMPRMSYTQIVFQMLSLFIDEVCMPRDDLSQLIESSFSTFEPDEILPLVPLCDKENNDKEQLWSMELFHGPTLSFKDIAMGFLMNIMDYFLQKQGRRLSIILATTGDTGPAAAFAAAGKPTIDCWPLFPEGRISMEQRIQMTTLGVPNIHPVSVSGCRNGGDDIDRVVAALFSKTEIKKSLDLSSVNSINWCRVMVQAAHYAYAYSRVCKTHGGPVDICVPSGAFGNLFAGFLAREMGVPIRKLICANNANQTLHRVFSTGVFKKTDLQTTVSSAIDIVIPYNFWRFLYFSCGSDPQKLSRYMDEFERNGEIRLEPADHEKINQGFVSMTVTDDQTMTTIREFWGARQYLLDPHSALAVYAAKVFQTRDEQAPTTICLATAHPAKFPEVIRKTLGSGAPLPAPARHTSIETAKQRSETALHAELSELEHFLIQDIGRVKAAGGNIG